MTVLNKIHNLMLNCKSTEELQFRVQDIKLTNFFSDHYDALIDSVLVNPVLASECTVLPIYYLQASAASGMRQDRFGKWYK